MKRRFLIFIFCVLSGLLYAQSTGVVLESESAGTIDWVAEILKGGITAIVLLLVGFAGVVFIFERMLVVRVRQFVPSKLKTKLTALAEKSDFAGIERVSKTSSSTLAEIAGYVAQHTHLPFEILSIGVSDMIMRMVNRQRQRTYPLAVVATISPLLGLLGTIIGMIEAFQKVALMGDTGDASVLADSIGKALITTAIGLIIAIPALAAYHFFKSRINSFGIELEEAVDRLMAPWLRVDANPGQTPEAK